MEPVGGRSSGQWRCRSTETKTPPWSLNLTLLEYDTGKQYYAKDVAGVLTWTLMGGSSTATESYIVLAAPAVAQVIGG